MNLSSLRLEKWAVVYRLQSNREGCSFTSGSLLCECSDMWQTVTVNDEDYKYKHDRVDNAIMTWAASSLSLTD